MKMPSWDLPEEIVDGCIKAQRALISGYKGNTNANKQKFKEALTPKHAAISLTGEPTLYSHIGELIKTFHNRGFTTFLVSNGTLPSVLAGLSEEPSQLYVSVCAPEEEVFKHVCRPQIPKAWEKLNDTLALLPSFKCPTAIRITLVRGFNMERIESYAKLIENANPTYIEPKAYMHVGFSRLRLGFENMPSHKEVQEFATKLAEETGYFKVDEACDSRVVLLSRVEKPVRLGES